MIGDSIYVPGLARLGANITTIIEVLNSSDGTLIKPSKLDLKDFAGSHAYHIMVVSTLLVRGS